MTPELLRAALERALASLDGVDQRTPKHYSLERSKQRRHGHWSTNIALLNAQSLGTDPMPLAAQLADRLREDPRFCSIEIAPPGFLNMTMSTLALAQIAAEIVRGEVILADLDVTEEARVLRPVPAGARDGVVGDQNESEALRFVQTAHAEACRHERRAIAGGIDPLEFEAEALTLESETDLLLELADLPAGLRRAAPDPERILRCLEAISEQFSTWVDSCTLVPTIDVDITSTHASRLVLDQAVIRALSTGLELLGARAPERM